ncbi:putative T7SS-secreted protein [Sphaerisporangium dianthi]|uniref:T7SS-secreted protein n=1 Tax=Sphaerisporangium dianthi TaxID=1436120 RepID=A0ABV9CKZ9_9ACTN
MPITRGDYVARRHTSGFDVLGMSADPTPGDPDEIRRLADRYQEIADQAKTAADILGKGGAVEQGKGKAMDALRAQLKSLPDKLAKTRDSFETAAGAYKTYATQLEEAQSQVDRAMDQAGPAAGTAGQSVPTLPPDATADQKDAARKQQEGIDAAGQTMSAARSLAEQARNLREQASRRAGQELDDAAAKAIPERNFFQKIADFFKDFPFVKILIDILVAVVTVFFPVVGFVLGAALFAFQTVQQLVTGDFKAGDFAAGLIALVPGGALFRLGGRAATTAGSKIAPGLFKGGAEGGGFFQTASGSIGKITDTFANSKPFAVAFESPGGKLITGTIGQFGKAVGEEAIVKKLNGDEITAGNLLAGAAGGALTGGLIKGVKGTREGEFSGGAFTPAPGGATGTGAGTATIGTGGAGGAGGAGGGTPTTVGGGAGAGNAGAPGGGQAGNAGAVNLGTAGAGTGNAGAGGRQDSVKDRAIQQGIDLVPEGVSAAAKIGVAIGEGQDPGEAVLSEAGNFLPKAVGSVGKSPVANGLDSIIPFKGTAPPSTAGGTPAASAASGPDPATSAPTASAPNPATSPQTPAGQPQDVPLPPSPTTPSPSTTPPPSPTTAAPSTTPPPSPATPAQNNPLSPSPTAAEPQDVPLPPSPTTP